MARRISSARKTSSRGLRNLASSHQYSSFSDEEDDDGEGLPLKKGPWTSKEDEVLESYVNLHGEGNWNLVKKETGLMRCGKSCRLRWLNHLRPDLKKGPFTLEEQHRIIKMHAKMGNKWARMAAELPGRTDNEIKNYWNTRIKKQLRAGRLVYPTDLSLQLSVENKKCLDIDYLPTEVSSHPDLLQEDSMVIPNYDFGSLDDNQGVELFSDYGSSYQGMHPGEYSQELEFSLPEINHSFIDPWISSTDFIHEDGENIGNSVMFSCPYADNLSSDNQLQFGYPSSNNAFPNGYDLFPELPPLGSRTLQFTPAQPDNEGILHIPVQPDSVLARSSQTDQTLIDYPSPISSSYLETIFQPHNVEVEPSNGEPSPQTPDLPPIEVANSFAEPMERKQRQVYADPGSPFRHVNYILGDNSWPDALLDNAILVQNDQSREVPSSLIDELESIFDQHLSQAG